MENIIAGRFETDDEARSAASSLADFVSENDIFIFFNNQPGAHDSDRDADLDAAGSANASAGDTGAGKGATVGAASGGVAAATVGTLVGGPAVGAMAAAVGAYTGSLAGTAGGLPEEGESTNKTREPRSAGMMLAVRVAHADNKQGIIERLRQHGAADIEIANGTWANGEWADFDPVALPQRV